MSTTYGLLLDMNSYIYVGSYKSKRCKMFAELVIQKQICFVFFFLCVLNCKTRLETHNPASSSPLRCKNNK
jgi:hypothetical protein